MEEEKKSSQNPESEMTAAVQEETIVVKVLLKEEPTDADAMFFTVNAPKSILSSYENPVFASLFESVKGNNQLEGGEQQQLWVDARGAIKTLINEGQALTLARFIAYYSEKVENTAKAFQSYKEFQDFMPTAIALGLDSKIDFEKAIKNEVQMKFPILVLIDVGGSIMCRTGQKLPIKRQVSSKEYCQIKMHHHYYRPMFDDFLAQLLAHPRIQLGFYTSIMRKNVMPLLFKIFELPKLNPYRSAIFDVFDQNYNVPDLGEGKKEWATKRSLEKVFDHQRCKEFGFGFHNTILIDSELDKVKDYPKNSIVLKGYEESQIENPTEDQSKILLSCRDYVFDLVASMESVPDYVSAHPFTIEGSVEPILSAQQQDPESTATSGTAADIAK